MHSFSCILRSSILVVAIGLVINLSLAQNIGILPTPQQIEQRDGSYQFAGNPVVENLQVEKLPVPENMEQAYILEILPQKVVVRYTTEVGRYYAMLSLQQMIDHYNKDKQAAVHQLPCLLVTDYPAMQYRGWMDDISRGPVPSMDFIKREIETMAQYKMNFFNLYTEHVFKLEEYPDIAPTDGLTAAEIKELEEFAAQYHIEMFGNQQCLAHAEKTLRIPLYQDMADTKTNYNPGAEKTREFLKYQLETTAQAYKSPFFNIDCDETEAMGNGRAADFVQQSGGAGQTYANHILWVYDILKKQGKRVMMWGDIAAKDPLITAQLPKDMLMIVWSYGAADSYVDMLLPFKKQNLEFMVAPGMSMWSTVCPSYDTYTKNIANLVRDGYQNGALGMMNTAWDDSGESLFNSAWHGMVWAAEMSWKPIQSTQTDQADVERKQRLAQFDELFSKTFVFTDEDRQLMKWLENIDIAGFFQSSSLYESVFDFYPTKVSKEFMEVNQKVIKRLSDELKQRDNLIKRTEDYRPQHLAPMTFVYYACQRQKTVAERNILRYKLYQYLNGNNEYSRQSLEKDIQQLLDDLHATKKMYVRLWDEECRAYSRDIVEKRFDAVAQELLNIPNRVFIHSQLNEKSEAVVTLNTLFGDRDIYYSIDGRKPRVGERTYTGPFTMSQSAMVRAMTKNTMSEDVLTEQFVLLHKGLGKIAKLNTAFANYRPEYEASGVQALADGIIGGDRYADGTWQGYWGNDVSVDFDFGKTTEIHHLTTHFYQDVYDWIMSPNSVEIYTSKDGEHFTLYRTLTVPNVTYASNTTGVYSLQVDDLNLKARYVRVVAKNAGVLPSWHQAKGQPSYIFCDEIMLQ